ncbi:MAG TPA: hypothetical protein VGP92_03675 [Acidimicrobiia bacterium]|nr:hypothetical protein [Acidimicrobiia bacterium]
MTREQVPATTPVVASPLAIAAIAVGAGLAWWAAPHLARASAHRTANALSVASRGTVFPSISHVLTFTIRSSVLILLAVALIARFSPMLTRVKLTPRASVVALVVLVVAGAAVYGWFGYPHNAFPSNSRYHWVDIYFDRRNNWYYTLVKLPHRIFYNAPQILQALNGAANVALTYAIGRTIFRSSRVLPSLFSVAYLASSLMLLFANTAEDVQLNIAVLMLAYLLYLRRSTPWLGLALFIVVLGRPQLVVVWAAFVATELLVTQRGTVVARVRALFADRFVTVNLAVATALFVLWDLLLVVRHQNWLLHNGHVIDSALTSLKPIPVDGFTISPFSGAYVLHGLWIFPTTLMLGSVYALWRVRELPDMARRALVFGLIVVTACLFVSEAEPLFYFNVRYLAYLFPFLIVTGFTVLALPPPRRRPIFGRPALAALLCLGVVTTRWIALDQHRIMVDTPITRAFAHKGTIDSIVGRANAGTTMGGAARNYVSYLLRRPIDKIALVRPGRDFHGFVFTTGEPTPIGTVVWRNGTLVLTKVP